MNANVVSDHRAELQENQCDDIILLSWIDKRTGNVVQTPQFYAIQNGSSVSQVIGTQDNAPAPSPQIATQQQNNFKAVNVAKSLKKGQKAHSELQERLKKKQPREQAIKEIAARMREPAYIVKHYIKMNIEHLKQEKEQQYRAVIIEALRDEKTDKEIATTLGLNEKTVAKRRRAIERELLETVK